MNYNPKTKFNKSVLNILIVSVPILNFARDTETIPPSFRQNAFCFTQNNGQYDPAVKYTSTGNGMTLFFTDQGMSLVLKQKDRSQIIDPSNHDHTRFMRSNKGQDIKVKIKHYTVKIHFTDANPRVKIVGEQRLAWNSHYFKGKHAFQWITDVPNFSGIRYENLYEGIDLLYYGHENRLKYDLIVQPGYSPSRIRFVYHGIMNAVVDRNGTLNIQTPLGHLSERRPFAYQNIKGIRKEIDISYRIDNISMYKADEPHIKFDLGPYDTTLPLIIDPEIIYSTYIGSAENDPAFDIAVDSAGCMYIIGETEGLSFPVTAGAYDENFNGGWSDVYVSKFNAEGTSLVYSTYIGGSENDEAFGLTLDTEGQLYLTGVTKSKDFPVTNGAYDESFNGGWDCFVAKLNYTGNDLIFSTYLGGSSIWFDWGQSIAVDRHRNVYITGNTYSEDFPTTPASFDNTYNGGETDAFVTKLNASGATLEYSTFLGGSSIYFDMGNSIAVDNSGNAYVAGRTSSIDFPVTSEAFDINWNGNYDSFICKIDSTGSHLIYSTYIGGMEDDVIHGLALDTQGYVYATGNTKSVDFPVTPGAWDQNYNGGFSDVFVSKINHTGDSLIYATFIGGSNTENGYAIAVDESGLAWITGSTLSDNFPVTDHAFDINRNGFADAMVSQVNHSGTELLYSTFLGGEFYDFGYGIASDLNGSMYITGETQSHSFPVTENSFDNLYNGFIDAFITKIGNLPSDTPSFIDITSPNSTEIVWETGKQYVIRWISDGEPDFLMKIELFRHNTLKQLISQDISNEGYKSWTVSTRLQPGDGYQIKISFVDFPSVSQMSQPFTITTGTLDTDYEAYMAPRIQVQYLPVLDGILDDLAWAFVEQDSLLHGGEADVYNTSWTRFEDHLVTWKALWCEETSRLYVALSVCDDIRGTFDNGPLADFYLPFHDESLEFYVDGDFSGGDYWKLYGPAQQWRVTGDNHRDLSNYPNPDTYPELPYTGNNFVTAVNWGENGDWNCEASIVIFNEYPNQPKALAEEDHIGWEIWYNDADNEVNNGDYYEAEHITGWNYKGKAWRNADYFGLLTLGEVIDIPALRVTTPDQADQVFLTNQILTIKWEASTNIGSYVKIDLYQNNTFATTITDTTPNDNAYAWFIPNEISLGSDYKIRITSHVHPTIWDMSDHGFSIEHFPTLHLTFPDTHNITWFTGKSYSITWTSAGNIGNAVNLSLYHNNIRTGTIIDSTENDSRFIWTIPEDITTGTNFKIRIQAVYNPSVYDFSDSIFSIITTSVVEPENNLPHRTILYPNFPNPFNPETSITYDLENNGRVQLIIFNMMGKKVKTLIDLQQKAGSYTIHWAGKDDNNQPVSSGIYIYQLITSSHTLKQNMLLIR